MFDKHLFKQFYLNAKEKMLKHNEESYPSKPIPLLPFLDKEILDHFEGTEEADFYVMYARVCDPKEYE